MGAYSTVRPITRPILASLCDVLVPERDFLTLEQRLHGLFPKMQIALRVASPGLAEDFRKRDIAQYTDVLKDFLRRQSPRCAPGWTTLAGTSMATASS